MYTYADLFQLPGGRTCVGMSCTCVCICVLRYLYSDPECPDILMQEARGTLCPTWKLLKTEMSGLKTIGVS